MSCIRPNRDEALDNSFYTHIWMINKLLGPERTGPRPFLLYVIASCYLKMLTRMEYRTSEIIGDALKKISTFDFSEQTHEARSSEKDNDRNFLSTLLRYKPLLDFQTDTPNLTHRAELETLPHEHDFYTKETCFEFHRLLSELLGRLHKALKILDFSRGKVGLDEILVQLELIARLGYLVKLIVKGAAIKKHLKVIEKFLPDRPAAQVVKQEEAEDEDEDNEDEDEDNDDSDEDLDYNGSNMEARHQAQPRLPKWQIWSDWLEVMVIHFDSTQILGGFVNSYGPNLKLDIKVLWQPLPDKNLLPWRELLQMIAPPSVADDLIQFLEPEVVPKLPAPTAEDVCRLVNDLRNISRVEENVVVFAKAIDHITFQMRSLTNYSVPWSEPTITSVVDALDTLKVDWIHTTQRDLVKKIAEISKKIRALMKCQIPTAEDIGRLVDDLGKIPRVEENMVVFTNAVDQITPQMKALTDYTVPWSEHSIISMVDKLDSLKYTWLDTAQDDLIKEITWISKKLRASKKLALTAGDVSVMVKDLSKIPRVEENVVFTNAIDRIIPQVKMLMTPLPWSEPLITSIVCKLDLLKGTWKCTTQDELMKEIAKIVEGIATLRKRPTAEDLGRIVKALGTIPQTLENVPVFIDSIDHIVFQMAALTNCSSPWSEAFIKSIVGRLNSFKHMWVYTTQEDSIKEITKIAEMIRSLRDNAKLFHALEPTEPLSTGIGFKGTHHCESGVAAFCCIDPQWSQIVSHLFPCLVQILLMSIQKGIRAVGVSKRCCPSCAYLLRSLGEFTYTHSHTTISACSLPESLPLAIITGMVAKFGSQLIRDLRDLKARTEMLTSIDPSIGSGKVSIGSEYPTTDQLE
jgi:hypothetical protein